KRTDLEIERPRWRFCVLFAQQDQRSRSGLLPLEFAWRYCSLIREPVRQRDPLRAEIRAAISCDVGAIMSGVIVSMRRTLLSCTSLARNGLIGLAAALLPAQSAQAADQSLLSAISTLLGFNRQEIAVLTTAFALLGFSVVAAILLMRSRVVSARNEARLRAGIGY